MTDLISAEKIIQQIYRENRGLRFVFIYLATVDQDISWAVKGHPMIEHKTGFGNVLRNIADKLDKMYAEKYGKNNKYLHT